jgi:hypothetical protein
VQQLDAAKGNQRDGLVTLLGLSAVIPGGKRPL